MYGANEAAEEDDPSQPRFIRITDIDTDGNLREDTFKSLPLEIAKPYLLKEGDVLLARSGATVGKSFIYSERSGAACFAGYLIRARLNPFLYSYRFFSYCCQTDFYWQYVSGTQIKATIQNVSAEKYANLVLPAPDIQEQSTIAAFLDRETAKIDTLIAKQEKLIDLLKEKRQAVISHAVTKGLDSTAPMKPSGVEWLGDVPKHWAVSGFTKYLGPIIDYRGRTPTKIKEGVLLLTARNIKNGKIDYSASQEYISEEEYPFVMQRGRPEIGDVLFTMEAPLGQVANIDQTGIALAQRIVKFRGLSDVIDNYYLKYWIIGSGCQCQLEQLGTGSTALGIKSSKLGQIQFCFPNIFEQKSIVAYLERTTTKIDLLIAKAQQAITLQKEHRTALISAAVTGKIDVRGEVEVKEKRAA